MSMYNKGFLWRSLSEIFRESFGNLSGIVRRFAVTIIYTIILLSFHTHSAFSDGWLKNIFSFIWLFKFVLYLC